MNFKKNFKRFFTLSRSAEGFTLVELIVVIAILGILVGVGMPAYGSYVESANKGVDRNNLAIVNNAFAIACIEHGVEPATGVSDAVLHWDGNKVDGLSSVTLVTKSGASTTNQDIITSFAANLGAGVEFKVHTSSDITFANGKFVSSKLGAEGGNAGGNGGEGGSGTGTTTVKFKDYDVSFEQEDINNLTNSTFGSTIGAQPLLNKVGAVSDIASALLGGDSYSVIDKLIYGLDHENPDMEPYMENLAGMLNISNTDLENKMAAAGVDTPEELNSFLANSLVLTAANKTTGMSTDFLGKPGFATQLQTDLDDPAKATDALAQAAMAYGMYTAYANSSVAPSGAQDRINSLETSGGFAGLTGILSDLDSDGFRTYLASPEGQADLAAYQSAMNVINDSANSSSDAAVEVMANGFSNDADLSALLGQLMTPSTGE